MSQNDRFLKACRLEEVDCTPVWFMRQAGRYMKAYRDIREKHGLMEMFKTPELATRITLQPVKAFAVDAAIIFADILLPLEGMGFELEFAPGPVIRNPVRSSADVGALRALDPEADLDYVLKSLAWVRSEIDGKTPLIGFAGGPFTLASYAIEGGASSNGLGARELMHNDPAAWDLLMTKLSDAVVAFLKAQARAGAQAVQVFDSWVGCLSPADYRANVLPHMKRLFRELKEENILSIHFGTSTAGLLHLMAEAGGDVIGVDWRVSLAGAWKCFGREVAIQGNLDPALLMAPWPAIARGAAGVLEEAALRPGHLFNLGHGILPTTPEDSVKALVEFVHEQSRR